MTQQEDGPIPEPTLPWGDINFVVVTDVHSWVGGHDPIGILQRNQQQQEQQQQQQQDERNNESRNSNDDTMASNTNDWDLCNADYGYVLSFYERLQQYINTNNNGTTATTTNASMQPPPRQLQPPATRDIFFVMNGDFMDGTGLSTIPPRYLTPILQYMPWDAINIGNHELYHNETIEYLLEPDGILNNQWKGKYITSNTFVLRNMIQQQHHHHHHQQQQQSTTTGSIRTSNTTMIPSSHDQQQQDPTHEQQQFIPLGIQYKYLIGHNTGYKILTFGFLYNFQQYCSITHVQRVEETIQQEWFINVVQKRSSYDAIVVLAHMDCIDPLVTTIHTALRNLLYNDTTIPILFITGHSHRRAYAPTSHFSGPYPTGSTVNTASFEAGHFLDTIGFVSITIAASTTSSSTTTPPTPPPRTILRRSTPVVSKKQVFQYQYITANQNVLRRTLHVPEVLTDNGRRLSQLISQTREALHLNDILGYIPQTYQLSKPYSDHRSLWRLYMEHVIPQSILRNRVPTETHPNQPKQQHQQQQQIIKDASRIPIYMQSTGALRFDLQEGVCTRDNVIAVAPFNDTIEYLDCTIPGSILSDMITSINLYSNNGFWGLPRFISVCRSSNQNHPNDNNGTIDVPCRIQPDRHYTIITTEFDAPALLQAVNAHVFRTRSNNNTTINIPDTLLCTRLPFCDNYNDIDNIQSSSICWDTLNVWISFVSNERNWESVIQMSNTTTTTTMTNTAPHTTSILLQPSLQFYPTGSNSWSIVSLFLCAFTVCLAIVGVVYQTKQRSCFQFQFSSGQNNNSERTTYHDEKSRLLPNELDPGKQRSGLFRSKKFRLDYQSKKDHFTHLY